MTAPIPAGERPTPRSYAPAPLLTALVTAAACVGGVMAAPRDARVPVAWAAGGVALLLCLAVAVASHSLVANRLLRRRLDTVAQDAGRLVQERARLVEDFAQQRGRLTGELTRETNRLTAELAQERVRLAAELDAERARLDEERERLGEENARLVRDARQSAAERDAAVAATANAAGRMQALATGTLADLRAMEERHTDEDVLADLLHLDHRTAQAGRLADSVAVLAGARSGRRWARPISMESILRGAMGRIGGYQRVRMHSVSETAIAGHAAEGVMHALAELLDNAANFSPPTAEVHVYVEEVPAGVIVSVEDSGLVMGESQLHRAERAVSGDGGGLAGLSGTRLGLAVVGRLARRYGLKVSFRPSARGGTGVLILIPQNLLTRPETPRPTSRAGTTSEREADPATTAQDEGTPTVQEWYETGGLPTSRETYDNGGTRTAQDPYETGGARTTQDPYETSGARTTQDPYETGGPLTPQTPHGGGARTAHPADDPAPEPMPGHEPATTDQDATAQDATAQAPTLAGLPKRRRGHTLAAAERARSRAKPPAAPKPPEPCDAHLRAARFGTFRQAARGSDTADPQEPEPTTARPATSEPVSDQLPDPTAGTVQIRALDPTDSSAALYSTLLADVLGPDGTGPEESGEPAEILSHPEGDTTS